MRFHLKYRVALADHTLIFNPLLATKSNLASKTIWLLSQGLVPSFVIFPTLQDVFTGKGFAIASRGRADANELRKQTFGR